MAIEHKRLGKHGVFVSNICLGTMNFGWHTAQEESFKIMDRALELGINFFDTADVYGRGGEQGDTEEILGRWFAQGGGRRDAVILATKVFNPVKRKANLAEPNTDGRSLSAYKIRKHSEGSLKRLQTDHIDLYQMHHVARDCPWDEIWQAFEQLGNQGKVVYVGSSNFAGWDIATACQEALKRGLSGLSSEQSIYHLNKPHGGVGGLWKAVSIRPASLERLHYVAVHTRRAANSVLSRAPAWGWTGTRWR
jgi:aryl-alcohol dehydrogenase-like predicted oxidoreductase